MRVDFVLLADATNESAGKLNILGAGISRLTPHDLPSVLPQLALVVRVELDDEDFERPHRIDVDLFNPEGNRVVPPFVVTLTPEQLRPLRETLLDGEMPAAQLTLVMQGLQFRREGVFEFVVSLDGEEVRRYPVVLAIAPGAT